MSVILMNMSVCWSGAVRLNVILCGDLVGKDGSEPNILRLHSLDITLSLFSIPNYLC